MDIGELRGRAEDRDYGSPLAVELVDVIEALAAERDAYRELAESWVGAFHRKLSPEDLRATTRKSAGLT